MGERFFCESFSETKSGKRATHFEPVLSHGLSLKRFFCEQEARKMQGGHDESFFGRNLTWGGRWSAIDCRCEALFVDFSETSVGRSSEGRKASQKLADALQSPSRGFYDLFRTFS